MHGVVTGAAVCHGSKEKEARKEKQEEKRKEEKLGFCYPISFIVRFSGVTI